MRPSTEEWNHRQSIIDRLRDKGDQLQVASLQEDSALTQIAELMTAMSKEIVSIVKDSSTTIESLDAMLSETSKEFMDTSEMDDPQNLIKALVADELRLLINSHTQEPAQLKGLLKDFENNSVAAFKDPRSMSLFNYGATPDNVIREVAGPVLDKINAPGVDVINNKIAGLVKSKVTHQATVNSPQSALEVQTGLNYNVAREKSRNPFKGVEGREIKFESNNVPKGV